MANKWKNLYERDYPNSEDLIAECRKWVALGCRVFVHGYSSMQCYEFKENQ